MGVGFLFTLEGRVSRRAYALTGVTLMALKYGLEALAIRRVTGVVWTPLDYLSPLYTDGARALAGAPRGFLLALGLWSLPFAWIGASMSLRRAVDAGWSPWSALAFFVPGLNYLLMVALACAPPRPATSAPRNPPRTPPRTPAQASSVPPASALLTVGLAAFLTGGLTFFGVIFAGDYGLGLFVGVPFLLGVVTSFFHNRRGLRSTFSTLGMVASSLCLAGVLLLLFALEGLVCILMVLPLVLPSAFAGAVLGRTLAAWGPCAPRGASSLCVVVPLLLVLEGRLARPFEFEVVSSIEIDAPPERVWPNVIGFADLPPPEHWLFETGIAYPLRARIEGEGVGAVRRCEFSTGAFVEPITRWEPPARLSFDVAEAPLPMEEWSFYARVRPPHLEEAFRAARGEFRLQALPGGKTRLEGSTWYRLELFPLGYWRFLADEIVHRIHLRVLEHVARLSESSGARR